MKFVFIDEIEQQQKNPKFFGVGAVVIDSNNYKTFKREFDKAFDNLGWNPKIEFKGRYLFSRKGVKSASIEGRLDFVERIAKASVASKNARLSFIFAYNYKKRSKDNYLFLIRKIVNSKKWFNPKKKTQDKNLFAFHYDRLQEIKREEMFQAVLTATENSKLCLFERPFQVRSDNRIAGIVVADIFCYLKSWLVLSPSSQDAQRTLFEAMEHSGNHDKKKLDKISEIFSLVKNTYEVQTMPKTKSRRFNLK